MGAEIGIGALLAAAGVSAVGNIAGSAISANGAQNANSQAMAFNAQQAQLNRAWQEKMYKQQLGDQENLYNKYQSTEAIAKSLQKIGVNAAGAFSSGNSGFSGSLPSVPGVPSGSQASIGSLENPYAAYGNAAKGVAGDAVSVLNAITDKKLKDAQAIKALQETNNLKVQEDILKWTDLINNTVGSEKAKAELNNIVVQTGLYAAQGEYQKASKLVAETIQKLNNKEFDIKMEELSQLQLRGLFLERSLNAGLELQKEEVKTEKSKQSVNYASAFEYRENAKTVRDIRTDVVRYHKSIADISDTKDFVTSNTAWNEVQKSLYELQASKLVPDQIVQAIEHAKKANDWYEVNELLGIVDEGVKAYGTYYGAKTGKGFVDAQNTSNRIKQDYNDYLKSKDNHPRTYTPEAPWNTRWR